MSNFSFARKNRVWIGAAAVVAVLLIGGLVVWQAMLREQARLRLEAALARRAPVITQSIAVRSVPVAGKPEP